EHELAARLFFDRHGERVAPRALVDGLDADDGPARPAEEFGGRLGRGLVRDAHDVAALAAVSEEPEDAVGEIAVADEVAEDVAELPPTVDGLRVVERAALGLTDEARHAHTHERRRLDLDLPDVNARRLKVQHDGSQASRPEINLRRRARALTCAARFADYSAAVSLISRLMREISSTHRWRSRWDICVI